MKTDELRLRVAHLLHRIVSTMGRIERKEAVDKFEVSSFHDDIYKLLERPEV